MSRVYVVDAYAWIDYLRGSKKGEYVLESLMAYCFRICV